MTTAVEQLERVLPPEAIERLANALARVDHAGTTTAVIHHGQDGRVTEVELVPATLRIRIPRRSSS